MQDIKKSLYFYLALFTILTLASFLHMKAGANDFNRLWFVLPLMLSFLAAVLVIREYGSLKTAALIVENKILYIQPVIMGERREKTEHTPGRRPESIEVFVSCFGILLGSKVIKFNQDGIRLKAVEIGRDCLSLDYGRDAYVRSIRLVHARPDSDILERVIEKFRYETGITPTVTR